MKILAIESSCDETAAAVVEDGKVVLSNSVFSQIAIHQKTGGVVPEVAAREHLKKIIPVIDNALKEAKTTLKQIDALAVTQGPGLISSLIIGTTTASALSYFLDKPLIPVNHISGHLYSAFLEQEEISYPLMVLTVSGGHNEIVKISDHFKFSLLGETLDDAAGEAFDKVARMLGLSYPGGPVISKKAISGDKNAFNFPIALRQKNNLNFSFSGLKTAVLYEIKNFVSENNIKSKSELPDEFISNISASFQETVVDTLLYKLKNALNQNPDCKEIHIVGGVSANQRLREKAKQQFPNLKIRFPAKMSYCTDNAAMIAAAAYYKYLANPQRIKTLNQNNVLPSSSLNLS